MCVRTHASVQREGKRQREKKEARGCVVTERRNKIGRAREE